MTGQADKIHPDTESIGYELAGSSAIFRGDYKLSVNPPPKGDGKLELYNIRKDPAEVHNLAAEHPELVAELTAAYKEYEKANGVIPVPDGYDVLEQLIKNTESGRAH